jgi:hypothetical protein
MENNPWIYPGGLKGPLMAERIYPFCAMNTAE